MPVSATAARRLSELVGAWSVQIESSAHGGSPGLLTFTGDGIVLGDEPPMPFETTAHGNWVASGPWEASYTFVALIGNAENNPPSRLKLVGALTYAVETDSWRGPFKIEVVAASGEHILDEHGTMTGTRIAVERLS